MEYPKLEGTDKDHQVQEFSRTQPTQGCHCIPKLSKTLGQGKYIRAMKQGTLWKGR